MERRIVSSLFNVSLFNTYSRQYDYGHGNDKYLIPSSLTELDELQMISRYCPLLLCGSEEEIVCLLKDNDDIIKEGVLHILAKAGGTIREQLAVTSRC